MTEHDKMKHRKTTSNNNPFVLLSQETTQAQNQDKNGDYEKIEAEMVAPGTPRPRRTQSQRQTPTKAKKISPTAAILAAIEELKISNAKLNTSNIELRASVKELKASYEATATALRTELAEVKEQLASAAKATRPTNASPALETNVSPAWSTPVPWSQLFSARTSSNISLSSQTSSNSVLNQEKVITVDLGRATEQYKDKPLEEIRAVVEKELSTEEDTKGVQVVGVSCVAVGRLEVKVATREQADTARKNRQWLQGVGQGVSARQAMWYPVKVDGVDREILCTKEGNGWQFKEDASKMLENSNLTTDVKVKIMKMHWLSKPSSKPVGSIVIYLDSFSVAQQLLATKELKIGPAMAYTNAYIQQEQPIRCYNCNQYRHMQSKCRSRAKCGNCAEAHQTKNCPGDNPDKCTLYTGAHKVTDPRCTYYIKEKEQIIQRQRQGLRR
jgi:hypothetical protein